jgi:hypothetical protein
MHQVRTAAGVEAGAGEVLGPTEFQVVKAPVTAVITYFITACYDVLICELLQSFSGRQRTPSFFAALRRSLSRVANGRFRRMASSR